VEVMLTSLKFACQTSEVAFLVVDACSNGFRALDICFFAWSFSMLLEGGFLKWGLPAKRGLKLMGVYGVECLD
jgi:hypothetical protein